MPGPAADEMATVIALMPMMVPRRRCGTEKRMFMMPSAMIAPPPSPCTKRAATSISSVVEKVQAAEASVKSATPARKTRRAPSISPMAPQGSSATRTASW